MEEPYLVPDYYPAFSCKMGACRRPCCEGWPISVSMKDYFHLMGLDASPELRRRLDSGLHLSLHPSEDAYAQILPRYDGICPLHMDDGRCMLHAECGESALAAVCRLYPRGVRNGENRECSCANSCEAVLELLLSRSEPLSFITITKDFALPDMPPRQHHFNTNGREQAIRLWLISQLQRREYPLPQRMALLGQALHAMEEALLSQDDAQIAAMLTGQMEIPAPALPTPSPENLMHGLEAVEQILAVLDRRSNSIRKYGEAALAHFQTAKSSYATYVTAAAHFATLIPHWEIWLEHLLVNHMYFVQFPFQDRPIPLRDEYLTLVTVYTLLRFLLLGCLTEGGDTARAVDVAAALFRLVDHTSFDLYTPGLMKELSCASWSRITTLISL